MMEVSHRRGPPPWRLGMKQRGVFVLKAPFALFLFSPGDHCNPPETTVCAGGEGAAVGAALWEALGY